MSQCSMYLFVFISSQFTPVFIMSQCSMYLFVFISSQFTPVFIMSQCSMYLFVFISSQFTPVFINVLSIAGIQTAITYCPAKIMNINKLVMFRIQFWDAGENAL